MKVLIIALIAAMTLMAETPKPLAPEDREALRVAQLALATSQQVEMQAQLELMATPQARKLLAAQEDSRAKLTALQQLVEATKKKYTAQAFTLTPELQWKEVPPNAPDRVK